MSDRASIEALLSLIDRSAHEAMAEYERNGQQVPSLDSTRPHPLDSAQDVVKLRKIIRTLEGACDQLCATLAPPVTTVATRGQNIDWIGLRVAVQAKIADVLSKYPQGLHVNELSKLVNIDTHKLTRILRVLATKHVFREVESGVFANNRLSMMLHSSSNISSLVYCNTMLVQKAVSVLYENLTDPTSGPSFEPTKSAFMQAAKSEGIEGTFYNWLKAHPNLRAAFGRAMIGLGQAQGSLSVLHHLSWENVQTVCDVGSGVGGFSMQLARLSPHVKLTLFDRPEVIDQAKTIWSKDHSDLLADRRVEFVFGDFFDSVPVEGQDIYYLRNIVHNWPSKQAIQILSNIRKVMKPQSRVLLHEYVLQNLVPVTQSGADLDVDKAPEPLLPNFGAGVSRAHYQDLRMLFVYNARERTLDEFKDLGAAAGLKLTSVLDLAEASCLEFTIPL